MIWIKKVEEIRPKEVLPNTVTQPRYIMVSIYQFILIIAVIKQKMIKFYEILQDFIALVI